MKYNGEISINRYINNGKVILASLTISGHFKPSICSYICGAVDCMAECHFTEKVKIMLEYGYTNIIVINENDLKELELLISFLKTIDCGENRKIKITEITTDLVDKSTEI